ncbi:MAG: CinA family protein [Rhodospirillaceae bacterium]
MQDTEILTQAAALLKDCQAAGLMVATAESCTGGLIAGALTEIAGSSAVVDRGFVTYSNEAKQAMLGVPEQLLNRHGAVSAEVAKAMAEGALEASLADLSIAVTGVAGPGGGSAAKPVGLVHFGCARRGQETHLVAEIFSGDRSAVRRQTIIKALAMLQQRVYSPMQSASHH